MWIFLCLKHLGESTQLNLLCNKFEEHQNWTLCQTDFGEWATPAYYSKDYVGMLCWCVRLWYVCIVPCRVIVCGVSLDRRRERSAPRLACGPCRSWVFVLLLYIGLGDHYAEILVCQVKYCLCHKAILYCLFWGIFMCMMSGVDHYGFGVPPY